MDTEQETVRRDWRIPDELWERIEPWLPPRTPHSLGGHRPRVEARRAMDAIFVVLRPACPWNALHATGLCAHRSAHRRCQAWVEADVFVALGAQGLVDYEALQGMDGEWLAMDGAMTTAPLWGGKGWASTPRTAARSAPNAASSPTAVACRSVWPWTARIGMMAS